MRLVIVLNPFIKIVVMAVCLMFVAVIVGATTSYWFTTIADRAIDILRTAVR
jgi:hypothetical protein